MRAYNERFFEKKSSKPDLSVHHVISTERRKKIDIHRWLYEEHKNDPAVKVGATYVLFFGLKFQFSLFAQNFYVNLKTHLLTRLLGDEYTGDGSEFTPYDLSQVIIDDESMYQHQTLRVHYTTYDMRRDRDSLNPKNHADFMVISDDPEDAAHPYCYGRILGIYHSRVAHRQFQGGIDATAAPCNMDFLFVRWYQIVNSSLSGWKAKKLHTVEFVPFSDDNSNPAFGFVNPKAVIRAVHLIPAFRYGRLETLLPPSKVARSGNKVGDHCDWNRFYVNM